jgi:glycosyltransferase involved in cell wall biosynthesis
MRVLHVVHGPDGPSAGGTERYAHAVARAQAPLGAVTDVWWGEGVPRARGLSGDWDNAAALGSFAGALDVFRPSVVHIHHLSGHSTHVAARARAMGARVVLTLHDAWVGCARGQLVDLSGARCAGPGPDRCARCLAPELWAPLPVRLARRAPLRRSSVEARRRAMLELLANVDLVLAPAPHLPSALGIDAEVLPLPLLRPVGARAACGPGPLRFLFLGALLPTKGPDVALRAFAARQRGPDATLTIAGPVVPWRGSDAWARSLLDRARATPGVTVEGAVDAGAVPALLHRHDVLCFPSVWVENSPLVAMEASAAGLVVLASDVPGARATAGGARWLPPGDVPAWSAAMDAEVARGRRVVPALSAPTLEAHAARLLKRYGACVAGVG